MVGDFLECLPELPNHVGDWLARWHGKNIRRQATWHQSTTSHPPLISNFPLLLKKNPNGSVLFCSILDHGLRGRQCCHFFPYLMFEFSIPWGGVSVVRQEGTTWVFASGSAFLRGFPVAKNPAWILWRRLCSGRSQNAWENTAESTAHVQGKPWGSWWLVSPLST